MNIDVNSLQNNEENPSLLLSKSEAWKYGKIIFIIKEVDTDHTNRWIKLPLFGSQSAANGNARYHNLIGYHLFPKFLALKASHSGMSSPVGAHSKDMIKTWFSSLLPRPKIEKKAMMSWFWSSPT